MHSEDEGDQLGCQMGGHKYAACLASIVIGGSVAGGKFNVAYICSFSTRLDVYTLCVLQQLANYFSQHEQLCRFRTLHRLRLAFVDRSLPRAGRLRRAQ